MEDPKLALIQMRVASGAIAVNLARAERMIATAAENGADVVVLPEAMDVGWAQPEAGELAGVIPGGEAVTRIQAAAAAHRICVCAGLTERADKAMFNSAVLVDRQGQLLLKHRKIHELEFARGVYSKGNGLAVCDTECGNVGLMICADAFVPGRVISRCLGNMGAKLILSPCAWAVPADHNNETDPYGQLWLDSYQPVAREFGLWIAGVSNVGEIAGGAWAGRKCIGNSMLIAPNGDTVAVGPYGEDAEAMIIEAISLPMD